MNYKILKFSADWCMPCKVLNKKLEDFTDCEVVKYDVDDVDEELLEKYRIRNIPVTILGDENEEEMYLKNSSLYDIDTACCAIV